MRPALLWTTIVSLSAIFAAPSQGPVYKIMPLGDSITTARKSQPKYLDVASYRYYLWNLLKGSNRCVDFVGSQMNIPALQQPQFNNFDWDHESGWSWRADQLADRAFAAAQATQPDIVLCHAGSVDLFEQQDVNSTVTDIEKIIDELRLAKSDVVILLAKVIPFGVQWNIDVTPLNDALATLVANKNTVLSPVVFVDHHTGWDPTVHTFDGVHPFGPGETRMADTWYAALLPFIPVCPGSAPTADFLAALTTGNTPHAVTFSNLSTGGATWHWDFGDGSTSSQLSPTHIYNTQGTYTVRLRATNSNGSDFLTKTNFVTVTKPGAGSPSPGILRVMPFGDSITEGRDTWATYRYFLWHQLRGSGHCLDFVGTKIGVRSGAPKYADFDQSHEGYDDNSADQLAAKAFAAIQSSNPDVVLCHVGSVDLFRGESVASTIDDIEFMVEEMRRADPTIKILLAKLIPFGAPHAAVDVGPLNALLPALVGSLTTPQSQIILVDHFTGWNSSFHSRDGVHPNELGEARMANTWHDAVLALDAACEAEFTTFGVGCAGSAGTPTLDVAAGQRPLIDTAMDLEFGALPSNTPVIGIIGLSETIWTGLPLPLDLGVIGMPGCKLYISYRFTQLLTSTPAGTLTWALPTIPNEPTLAGLKIYFQGAIGDPGQNPLGITVSNAGAAKIGVK